MTTSALDDPHCITTYLPRTTPLVACWSSCLSFCLSFCWSSLLIFDLMTLPSRKVARKRRDDVRRDDVRRWDGMVCGICLCQYFLSRIA